MTISERNGEPVLTNKVAVVTGGGTGIGRSIVTSPASRTWPLCSSSAATPTVGSLVNNAGVIGPIAEASEMDMELWDEVMAVNVRGVALVPSTV